MGNLCGCCCEAPDEINTPNTENDKEATDVNLNNYTGNNESLESAIKDVAWDDTSSKVKCLDVAKQCIGADLPELTAPLIVPKINKPEASIASRADVDNQTVPTVESINNLSGDTDQQISREIDIQEDVLCEAKLIQPSSNITFLTDYIVKYARSLNWQGNWSSQSSVKFFTLEQYWDDEYERIEQLFSETNKWCFKVTQIQRIQNPYLLAAFLLKKEEMEKRIGHQSIEELFHGTHSKNVMSICTDNLDWRLHGDNIGNKFGQGISFTPISNYATHYGDDRMNNRIMLLAHVLIGEECDGSDEMVVPPYGFDTTIKPDRNVIVKYEDNEFYPAYKITYCCTYPNELYRRRNNKRGNYNNGGQRKQGNNKQHFRRHYN